MTRAYTTRERDNEINDHTLTTIDSYGTGSGTTGFSRAQESQIKKYSKKIPILKAGNMSLGVNLLMYLTEIASKSLNDEYLSKIFEVHHKHKKDYPSGTALMLGKGIADGKNKNLYNLIGKKFLNKKSDKSREKLRYFCYYQSY